MVDAYTAILTGLFTGIGVETAKVLHELYIKPRITKTDKKIKRIAKQGFEL